MASAPSLMFMSGLVTKLLLGQHGIAGCMAVVCHVIADRDGMQHGCEETVNEHSISRGLKQQSSAC